VHVDKVCVVDDGGQHLARMVDSTGLLDQALLATDIAAIGIDLERVAQDPQHTVIGRERPVDYGSDQALGVVLHQGLFDDALAGARVAGDDAQARCTDAERQRQR
jgi:hypothetical protein